MPDTMPENNAAPYESYPETPVTSQPPPNNVDPETIQEIIALSVGNYVVVEFLVGTQNIVRKEGVLTAVGVSWLVLYDESTGTSIVCDMYSVKFVTYFDPGYRPTRSTGDNIQSAQRQMNEQRNQRGSRR